EFLLADESAAEIAARVPALAGRQVSVLIWTTTPWTIPSNLAIAFHPEFDYAAYEVTDDRSAKADGRSATTSAERSRVVIVAEELAGKVASIAGRTFGAPVARMKGAELERLRFQHPLYARTSLAVLGDYVTLDAGTGAVHTAPGHGADDFQTGVRYGLEIYAPVGPAGHFLETVELFGGQRVFDANPKVVDALAERRRLWHRESFSHQYPHCWRCHNPVIFLATSQWFIDLDNVRLDRAGKPLRAAALHAIDHDVKWIPSWGHDRMYNMIAHRPDWCISRQRVWGVPIPAVDCKACGEAIITPALVHKAAGVYEQYGVESWYERPTEDFIPEGLTCPKCGGTAFDREMNILDVWFDSGSSHEAVLSAWPELTWPADVYLEGTDQHRGWFQSSLMVGLGTRGRAPFRWIVTNGFVIDVDGKKMSKSIGNSIEPRDIIKESGADIVRLWTAMSDYREEIRVSQEILARVVEAYRKIRNTTRFLISNLYDFDPDADRVPHGQLESVDRYVLAKYADVAQQMLQAYESFDYTSVCQLLNAFTTVDLSAFYADVSKDRLYTFAPRSRERRSAQTAMYLMADGLTRLVAPVLSFTMDEAWRHLPGAREESVHIALFPKPPDLQALADAELSKDWDHLSVIRAEVLAEIEPLRKTKVIGSSLQAKVTLSATAAELPLLERYARDLPMLFIVSEVEVRPAAGGAAQGDGRARVTIERAAGVKCQRCWRYVPSVSADPEWAGVCSRCVDALSGPGSTAQPSGAGVGPVAG
ncbi:MAG TPA: class I tRNA ligase family protein, partial [Vicinamibacterales bacterium]